MISVCRILLCSTFSDIYLREYQFCLLIKFVQYLKMNGNRSNQSDPSPVPNAPQPNDLPPPYSAVVGNPQYGFVVPPGEAYMPPVQQYPHPGGAYVPKTFTAPGVYPHPIAAESSSQSQAEFIATGVPVGVVMAPAVGTDPTTVTCYNCGKVITTRVTYKTAWHTHLVAGSICVMTMVCSLCCLGIVPYCFDTFKDAEHYCPNCNTFIGKNNKC